MRDLIETLEKQLKQLDELLHLLRQETGELSGIQLEAMAETTSRKEQVSSQIEDQAATIRTQLEAAAAREGLPPRTRLGELAERYSRKGLHDLTRLHTRLNHTAEEVRQTLALNREIAERFSSSIGQTLDLMTRVINQASTYGASGGYQQQKVSAVIINREA